MCVPRSIVIRNGTKTYLGHSILNGNADSQRAAAAAGLAFSLSMANIISLFRSRIIVIAIYLCALRAPN